MDFKSGVEHRGRLSGGIAAGHDDEIEPLKKVSVVPEALSGDALDAVPVHRTPDAAARDCQSEAGTVGAVLSCQHREVRITRSARAVKNPLEVLCAEETPGSRESTRRNVGPRHPRQAVSRTLPLARRALMILRPPRVLMRLRKP